MLVEIQGSDLPGRRCGPNPEGGWYENVHVGPDRHPEPETLVPGDAPSARWAFEVRTRDGRDGGVDFGGPHVYGGPGKRFLYLTWGTLDDDGAFELFRAAKLWISDIDADVVDAALQPGARLVGRLGLSDHKGQPLCASVRPPRIDWSAER